MIYLDHAATSWPKPPAVLAAMSAAMTEAGGNPGRSGHRLSLKASEILYDCRAALAALFHIADPLAVSFAANATEALNLAVKGALKPGEHAIFSSMEHNAVWRPLKAMEACGVTLTMVAADPDGTVPPERIAAALRPNTRLVAVTHASNVNGAINDIAEIGAAVRTAGALFLVDAAQSAGTLPIDVEVMAIDLLAFPGHKGLLGPQGTGGLYIRPGLSLAPLKHGGTGSLSHLATMPDIAPDRYESGTLNTPGLAGLNAGLDWLAAHGIEKLRQSEMRLSERLRTGLATIPRIRLYGPAEAKFRAGIVAMTVEGFDCEELATALDREFAIAARAGLTCAPLAHRTLGTEKSGVLRLSVGATSSEQDINEAVRALTLLCSRQSPN